MGSVDFPAGFFERAEPERPADRMDDAAIAALRDLYSDLGIDGRVLDLGGSSARPLRRPAGRAGRLDGDPRSCPTATTRSTTCSARAAGSMTHPAETFAEVARVLRPGGRFVCTFADALRPRVIRGWAATDDAGRVRIVRTYFALAPAFGGAESDLRTSLTGSGDRLWAVWAAKRG